MSAAAETADTDGLATSRGTHISGLKIVWEMLRQLFESTMFGLTKSTEEAFQDSISSDATINSLLREAMLQRQHIIGLNRVVLRDAIDAVRLLNKDMHEYCRLKFHSDDLPLLRQQLQLIAQHSQQEAYTVIKRNTQQQPTDFVFDPGMYKSAEMLLRPYLNWVRRINDPSYTSAERRSLRLLSATATKLFVRNAFDSEPQTNTIVEDIVSKYTVAHIDIDALKNAIANAEAVWKHKLIL
jgi:hypothetical protein